ncbi:MAG: large-conductance mechanosensitive channel protein MscL [Alphaproteobacteria bacterium]|nr:large-conductance mechanosensitive channel protein MscL [Alphaproteobacteria bacterium]
MGMMAEFKEFAVKGNVIDMAVGIIIGAAFGKIVNSIVNDIVMPVVGVMTGGVDFSDRVIVLKEAVGETAAVTLNYGALVQVSLNFIIVAFAIFMLVKGINSLKRKEEAKEAAAPAPAKPSTEEVLLTEIRDLLKAQQ